MHEIAMRTGYFVQNRAKSCKIGRCVVENRTTKVKGVQVTG